MPEVELVPKTDIWYTADGRDIQVRQMDENHIRNCLRLIDRRFGRGRPWRVEFGPALRAELHRRFVRDAYLRG